MSDTPPYPRLARWLEDQLAATGEGPTEIERRTGINRSNFGRWKAGLSRPDVENSRKLAGAFRRPLLEVLVVAEIVTEAEAKLQTTSADPSTLTDGQLLGEIGRRLDAAGTQRRATGRPRTPMPEPSGSGQPGGRERVRAK